MILVLLIHLQVLVFLGFPSICLTESPNDNIPLLPSVKCYDKLGCLNITQSWYHTNRPRNVFPQSRSEINTTFILYTRNNPSQGQIINVQDEKSFKKSNFGSKKSTKFIIHGFFSSSAETWVGDMKDELIKAEDMNVIAVDWSGGSTQTYTIATANTRLVGLEIAYFINSLIKSYNLEAKKVHLIGHSLGAHTAGYAGERVPGLGRITGLDPAKPFFQSLPVDVRLDPSDAKLVDVIHTDGEGKCKQGFESGFALGLGISETCGHLDFYPNNGKEQPGCDFPGLPTLIKEGQEEAFKTLTCNHMRAFKLFTESINSKCPYVARQCPSYEEYVAGKCFSCNDGSITGGCALMGYHANESPVLEMENEISQGQVTPSRLFFMKTGGKVPYCQHNYRISIQLAKSDAAVNWVKGFLKISLHGDDGVIHNLKLKSLDSIKLKHGTAYTVVVSHPTDLGAKIRKVELKWEYFQNTLKPETPCLNWCNLYVKSISVDKLELPGIGKHGTDFSNTLCTSGQRSYADIPNHGKGYFYNDCRP